MLVRKVQRFKQNVRVVEEVAEIKGGTWERCSDLCIQPRNMDKECAIEVDKAQESDDYVLIVVAANMNTTHFVTSLNHKIILFYRCS